MRERYRRGGGSGLWRQGAALVLLAGLLMGWQPALGTARAAGAPAVTLTLGTSGAGGVAASPIGPTYPAGTIVTLTADPGAGVLVGWTIDGRTVGWANPRTIIMDADHRATATFAPRPTFGDLPAGAPAREAVTQLAARGIIKGYSADECAARGLAAPCFAPADGLLRAQVAALIARALGWLDETPANTTPFRDLAGIDPELQRAIASLAARGIVGGYGDATFGPTDRVLNIQVVSFVVRAMVQAGLWRAVTSDDPTLYPNVPLGSGHRLDLLTFVRYAGPIIDRPAGQAWADWNAAASRGWTARTIWQGLDSALGTAAPIADPSPTNDPPVAIADEYATPEGTSLTVAAPGLLGNDRDPEGDRLVAIKAADPDHGALALNADGSFTYVPAAGFSGTDAFAYRARDTAGALSLMAAVTVRVAAVNGAPINGVPPAQRARANTPLTFSAGGGNALTIADADAGDGALRVTLAATGGTLTLGSVAGLTLTVGDGADDATLTFTGTLRALNGALAGLTFAPTRDYLGAASLAITTDDQCHNGTGGPLADSDTVAITVEAGPPATLVKVAGDGGTATVGTTRAAQVRVTDGTGAPVPGYPIDWAVTAGGGSVGGPTSFTDPGGVATIDWTLGTTPGTKTLTAGRGPLAPVTFTATTVPDVAAQITITTQPGPLTASDTPLAPQPVVQISDRYGNAIAQRGVIITAALASGTGTLRGNQAASLADGSAQFVALAIVGAGGDYTLGFSAPGLTGATSDTITLLSARVSPNPDTIASATSGTPIGRTYMITNTNSRANGGFTGRAVGGPLGSALIATPTIADLASQQYPVNVPAGATALRATIGSPSDPTADLDLAVFNCTTGTCRLAGQSADSDAEESVTIANPAAGTWLVVVDAYAVPSGTMTYSYFDLITSPSFGTIAIADTDAARAPGSQWIVSGTVTATAAPAAGRVLYGQVQVRTSAGLVVGTNAVIVQAVIP